MWKSKKTSYESLRYSAEKLKKKGKHAQLAEVLKVTSSIST